MRQRIREQEEKIAKQLEKEAMDKLREERMIQKIREENPELRELENKLMNVYTYTQQQQQLKEKEKIKQFEKVEVLKKS